MAGLILEEDSEPIEQMICYRKKAGDNEGTKNVMQMLPGGSVQENADKVRNVLIETGEMDSVQENADKVRKVLIETGEMDRLKDFLQRKLDLTGWELDMSSKCREVVHKHGSDITFETLFQSVKDTGISKIPQEVKDELLEKIKFCYESETKEDKNGI